MPTVHTNHRAQLNQQLYDFSDVFTAHNLEEIESLNGLTLSLFETAPPRMTREHWMLAAQVCLGKAQMLDDGYYGEIDEDEGVDIEEWAEELRDIASAILSYFQPGDGKL